MDSLVPSEHFPNEGKYAHMYAHIQSMYTCEQMDSQKNTSDSSMKPAAATRVTTLAPFQGFKRNNQNVAKWKKVSWGRVHLA